jgi:anti-anti-sigma factor
MRVGATVVVLVSGAITTVAACVLEHRIAEAISPFGGRAPRMLLDLTAMTFVDRAGLDVLLDLQGRIERMGGEFELIEPSATVVRLLYDADRDPGPTARCGRSVGWVSRLNGPLTAI